MARDREREKLHQQFRRKLVTSTVPATAVVEDLPATGFEPPIPVPVDLPATGFEPPMPFPAETLPVVAPVGQWSRPGTVMVFSREHGGFVPRELLGSGGVVITGTGELEGVYAPPAQYGYRWGGSGLTVL